MSSYRKRAKINTETKIKKEIYLCSTTALLVILNIERVVPALGKASNIPVKQRIFPRHLHESICSLSRNSLKDQTLIHTVEVFWKLAYPKSGTNDQGNFGKKAEEIIY